MAEIAVAVAQAANKFRLTVDPLDLGAIYAAVEAPGHGAVVVMSGMVRDRTAGRDVAFLDYSAYEPMALRVFHRIAATLHQRYPDLGGVAIHHRLGRLAVGEMSVLVAVGAPHRATAFAACQDAIDTLKQDAPIWKKEVWVDGGSTWVNLERLPEMASDRSP